MATDPFFGAAVSGLGSIASSLIGNAGNRRAQDRANQQNIAFWKMQNNYNHPVEQMARLKKAGLNPNLIYGSSPSGAGGNAEKIAPSKAADYNIENPLNNISAFADYDIKNLQSDNLAEQNNVLVQDALLKNAQMQKTAAEGLSASTKAEVDKRLLETSVEAQKEMLRRSTQMRIGNEIDNMIKNRTAATKVKQEFQKLELLGAQITNEEKLAELRKLEIELKAEGIENAGPLVRAIFRQLTDPNSKLNQLRDNTRLKY